MSQNESESEMESESNGKRWQLLLAFRTSFIHDENDSNRDKSHLDASASCPSNAFRATAVVTIVSLPMSAVDSETTKPILDSRTTTMWVRKK